MMDRLLDELQLYSKIDDLDDLDKRASIIHSIPERLSLAWSDASTSDLDREVLHLRSRLLNCMLFEKRFDTKDYASPLATLDALSDSELERVFSLPPQQLLTKWLGLMSTFPVLTGRGMTHKNRLIERSHELKNCVIPNSWPMMVMLSWAWMFSSYATSTDRHKSKKVLNDLIVRWLRESGIDFQPNPGRKSGRPNLLIIAEVLKSSHVQFRYFCEYIDHLRSRFHVTIASPLRQVDEAARQIGDRFVALEIESYSDLSAAAKTLRSCQADVVFWPSVGMATWGPFLANLRFAPMQFCGLGHSATTHIPTMDYFVTEEGYVSDPACFSEKLILLSDESLVFRDPNRKHIPDRAARAGDGKLLVAIPCNSLKLNPGFIDTLSKIQSTYDGLVHFEFFGNSRALTSRTLETVFGKKLRSLAVLPRMETRAYLDRLAEADLVLSSFPFGGLHSTVDALCFGIPVVCMIGREPHSRTDALILRRLNLPEWLVAKTEQDYIQASVNLMEDKNLRDKISRHILSANPVDEFFSRSRPEQEALVANTILRVYDNHETIQSSNRRVWTSKDLVDLTGNI